MKRRDALPNSTISAVDGASKFDRSLYAMVRDTQQAQIDAAGDGFASRLAQMKVREKWDGSPGSSLMYPSGARPPFYDRVHSIKQSTCPSPCWCLFISSSECSSTFRVSSLNRAAFALCARLPPDERNQAPLPTSIASTRAHSTPSPNGPYFSRGRVTFFFSWAMADFFFSSAGGDGEWRRLARGRAAGQVAVQVGRRGRGRQGRRAAGCARLLHGGAWRRPGHRLHLLPARHAGAQGGGPAMHQGLYIRLTVDKSTAARKGVMGCAIAFEFHGRDAL